MSDTSRSSEREGADFADLSRAVAEGAGFRAMARSAARILGASLNVVDRSSAVLAVAAPSPEEERRLRSRGPGVEGHRLKVAGREVGELRLFRRGDEPVDPGRLELVRALFALELDRSRSAEWAEEEETAGFVESVLDRQLTEPEEIVARAARLGADLSGGGGVVIARFAVEEASDGGQADTGRRVLAIGLPVLRRAGRGALAGTSSGEGWLGMQALVAAADEEQLQRAARELAADLTGAVGGEDSVPAVGCSRHAAGAGDLFRAGKEALLALNVAEAQGAGTLSFEETGSHRLLLSAISENPAELEWFYSDTVAPLVTYDRQYGTDLVGTVEAFLRNDGNIAPTAEELFTHRHTVSYRLGRVRDLCGHDIRTTDGREQLGFGLKAMRVLGLRPGRRAGTASPPGP